jgi:hypothetical protein
MPQPEMQRILGETMTNHFPVIAITKEGKCHADMNTLLPSLQTTIAELGSSRQANEVNFYNWSAINAKLSNDGNHAQQAKLRSMVTPNVIANLARRQTCK